MINKLTLVHILGLINLKVSNITILYITTCNITGAVCYSRVNVTRSVAMRSQLLTSSYLWQGLDKEYQCGPVAIEAEGNAMCQWFICKGIKCSVGNSVLVRFKNI